MSRWRIVVALLLLVPSIAPAQSTAFTHLLGGTVSYRATVPWTVAVRIKEEDVDGVILQYQEERDTALTLAIVAYPVPAGTDFTRWTDSTLRAGRPGSLAKILADTVIADGARALLWKDATDLTMDRFVRTYAGILWIRTVMPSKPPHASLIRARLHAIDDVMTTIRGDLRLLFPDGSRLGLVVFPE